MLQGMRNASKGWVGRIVVGVLFGLLILSFLVWGIGDMMQGSAQRNVAKVGSTDITMVQMRNAYQNEIQRLTRQYRRAITPDQARAMGLDAQVLGRLVTEAVLSQQAKTMNLGVSDASVARSIEADPTFRGPSGQFDRAQFADLLRSNGLTEAAYVADQRATLIRRQIPEGIAGGITVPQVINEAVFRFTAERRDAEYFILNADSIGTIPAPDDAALQKFFDARKASFRAPEYRRVTVLALTPASIAKPAEVSDADARARYEQVNSSQFGTPERRAVQQINFHDEAAATAASAQIKAGKSFEDVAKERGIQDKDLDLGTVSKAEMFDPIVREAAFALPQGGVSEPVKGNFGPVILRVTAITPATVKPFEEVADTIRTEIAREKARAAVTDLHDRIEDQHAAAKPLAEIATSVGLPLQKIDGVDRDGRDKAGKAIDTLPDRDALLAAVFESDIGADNEALRTSDGGYIWYEVSGIDPARDRTLDESRAAVEALWRSDEIASRLSARARELVTKIDGGESIAAAAGTLPVRTASQLQRGTAQGDLSVPAVTQIFATHVGKAGSVALADGNARAVFKVTKAVVPPYSAQAIDKRLEDQISFAVTDDLLTEYVRRLQKEMGVTVNQQALRNAVGTAGTN